jgi:hypothetical protein
MRPSGRSAGTSGPAVETSRRGGSRWGQGSSPGTGQRRVGPTRRQRQGGPIGGRTGAEERTTAGEAGDSLDRRATTAEGRCRPWTLGRPPPPNPGDRRRDREDGDGAALAGAPGRWRQRSAVQQTGDPSGAIPAHTAAAARRRAAAPLDGPDGLCGRARGAGFALSFRESPWTGRVAHLRQEAADGGRTEGGRPQGRAGGPPVNGAGARVSGELDLGDGGRVTFARLSGRGARRRAGHRRGSLTDRSAATRDGGAETR